MIRFLVAAALMFAPGLSFAQAVTGGPYKLELADIVGDSNLDLVECFWRHGALRVREGQGDGTFTGGYPASVVVTPDNMGERHCHNFDLGDLDNDGDLDAILAIGGLDLTHPGTISIQEYTGNGVWTEVTRFSVTGQAKGANIGDWDGDGDADIAYTVRGRNIPGALSEGITYLCPGNGDLTFGTCNEVESGASSYYVEDADFNDDGHPDFAIPNERGNTVEVIVSPGATIFTATLSTSILTIPEVPFRADHWVNDVRAADFTGNGCDDLLTANYTSGTYALFEGACDGTFNPPVVADAGANMVFFGIGDFDGDGMPDAAGTHYLAATTFTSIFANQSSGASFFPRQQITIPGTSYGIAAGEITGDGKEDLVIGHYHPITEEITVVPGNGDGTFGTPVTTDASLTCTQSGGSVSC